ncbi:MAG: primosomal protein N' [Spirochaetaceae bacterium]|nr:primosomal protein N' [Spirochaetaceae bacterium]
MHRWMEVVLNVPVYQSFTYAAPAAEGKQAKPGYEPLPGKRAEVFFGSRRMTAYIIRVMDTLPPDCPVPESQIKPAIRILDEEPLFTDELIRLSDWIASYYLCSRGEALAAMLPSGRRETETGGFFFSDDTIKAEPPELSEEQLAAVTGILGQAREGKRRFHYLYGTTGSGKTEVFLHTAQQILSEGRGVIYLVPEIGLTHQVVEAVIRRFGGTAAVLHSGLTPSQRLTQWMRILRREARVVIGARSAVFAPVPDLGLIIIDEEHDGSYKSGSTPRYHARQVAFRRCTDLAIPLIMGSATPSVESWRLMEQQEISRHVLTRRLSGGAPPEILAVDLTGAEGCLSAVLEREIIETKKRGKQTILFLNRRGFTHFFRCNTCGFELKCKNCSVALTYHKSKGKMICHYCGWTIAPPGMCPECSSIDISYAGFGTEFIETELRRKFPDFTIRRADTDTLTHKGELQSTLNAFRSGEIDILLGTQLIAKGLNFPGVRLVGVVLADTGLHLPDFRAAERTFALLVQVAGRAGRFSPDGKVIVQSFNPERTAIEMACRCDMEGFYAAELEQRNILGFPPFSRLVRLVFRARNESAAEQAAAGAAAIIRQFLDGHKEGAGNAVPETAEPEILGPAQCPLEMAAGNYRWQLILRAGSIGPIQRAASRFLHTYKPPYGVYIEADIDPVNLL